MRQNKKFRNSSSRTPVGKYIKSYQVRCIDKDNNNLGVISTADALRLAADSGMELVQVSKNDDSDIPICRILDYGKYKYDQSKKQKAAAKKQRESLSKVKEIKLRPSTDVNDLKIKAGKAGAFLEDGHKVKVTVVFRGRELAHKSVGFDTLSNFIASLGDDIDLLNTPSMDGRILSAMIALKKKVQIAS